MHKAHRLKSVPLGANNLSASVAQASACVSLPISSTSRFDRACAGRCQPYSSGVTDAIIDLSHFNPNPNFALATITGVRGVIHKATQGVTFVDPAYAQHHNAAASAGLYWGAYHFGDGTDGFAQANFFLERIGPAHPAVLALDFEQNPGGPSMTLDRARAFVTQIQAVTGRWPGLYGGAYLKQMLGDAKDPVLGNCWFWLAQYTQAATVPANWTAWTLWQYTNIATVAGIGPCDRSRFNGSTADLQAFFTR
jgi:lysozyme